MTGLKRSILSPSRKSSETALITGATCGIGKAYAEGFARLGYDLIITGRRDEILQKVASEIRHNYHVRVHVLLAELSEDEDVERVIRKMKAAENLSVLVNNAGYGSGVKFINSSLDDHTDMLKVHVEAPLKLIYAILPFMISRRKGIIINISSMGAYTPAPGNTMYSSTKIFLKSFTESLQMEVRQYGIHLLCVCPGYTSTEFHKRRHSAESMNKKGLLGWMEADEVVSGSFNALEHDRIVHIPGIFNRLVVYMLNFLPKKMYYSIVGKVQGNKERVKDEVEIPLQGYNPLRVSL